MRIFLISCCLIFALLSCKSRSKTEKILAKAVKKYDIIEGERIDGPANVRLTPDGTILFSLDHGARVEVSADTGIAGWRRIWFGFKTTGSWAGRQSIPKDTVLLDPDGKFAARVFTELTVINSDEAEICWVEGFTHVKNILQETVPENVLSGLIREQKTRRQELEPFLRAYRFEPFDRADGDSLAAFYIYESIVDDPSPRDRLTLVFGMDGNLIYVRHFRKLPGFEPEPLIRGHFVTFVEPLEDEIRNQILRAEIWQLNNSD